jgi:hypothetical protein
LSDLGELDDHIFVKGSYDCCNSSNTTQINLPSDLGESDDHISVKRPYDCCNCSNTTQINLLLDLRESDDHIFVKRSYAFLPEHPSVLLLYLPCNSDLLPVTCVVWEKLPHDA